MFALFRTRLRRQFAGLGHTENADDLARHLLTGGQGGAALLDSRPAFFAA